MHELHSTAPDNVGQKQTFQNALQRKCALAGRLKCLGSLVYLVCHSEHSTRTLQPICIRTYFPVFYIDTCPEELMTGFQGTLLWPETFGGTSALLDCPVALDDRKVEFATRDCVAHSLPDSAGGTIPRWSSPNTTTCPSPLTKELHKLSKVQHH